MQRQIDKKAASLCKQTDDLSVLLSGPLHLAVLCYFTLLNVEIVSYHSYQNPNDSDRAVGRPLSFQSSGIKCSKPHPDLGGSEKRTAKRSCYDISAAHYSNSAEVNVYVRCVYWACGTALINGLPDRFLVRRMHIAITGCAE